MITLPTTIRLSIAVIFAAALATALPDEIRTAQATEMVELALQGRKLEGLPLSWNERDVHLLGRDGRLWTFDPADARDFHKTANAFRCYSPSEFRAELLRELGSGYEISGTGHYLVAHPAGQRDKWAQRFEDLYRSFVHYFSVRGFQPQSPLFPLVGVVCTNRDDFVRRAAAQGTPVSNGVTGYYDIESNRITLYDMGGQEDPVHWQQNAAVLIHEATHQTAFNTGVHSRYSSPPRWLAEGLAMLFEAPGIYDPHSYTRPQDRVNRDRLRVFQRDVAPRHRPELLASMISGDELFQRIPSAAYAEAWAFSFFLSEAEPRKYVDYLKRTAARQPFEDYPAKQRLADFVAIFGSDWRMLEARFLRFMDGIKAERGS